MKKYKLKADQPVHIFNVKIDGFTDEINEKPYRRIAISSDSTLYDLAEAVIDSWGFFFDHAFGFYDNFKRIQDSNEGYELFKDIGEDSKFPGVEKTKLDGVFTKPGKSMLFLFDYGDEWRFILKCVGIELPDSIKKYPCVLKKDGPSPEQYPDYCDSEIE